MRVSLYPCLLLWPVLSAGCSWVSLTDQGEHVEVVSDNEILGCERIGSTKASVLRKIWFVPRRRSVVRTELETLARNEGGALGGNTVTPFPSKHDGEREFAVYRCGD